MNLILNNNYGSHDFCMIIAKYSINSLITFFLLTLFFCYKSKNVWVRLALIFCFFEFYLSIFMASRVSICAF